MSPLSTRSKCTCTDRKDEKKFIYFEHTKYNFKTRESHAVPMLVCQGPSFYLKILVKKGVLLQNYSFQSYAPCPAKVWC